MLKLIICLLSTVATAVCIVNLRQQRLEMTCDLDRLHGAVIARQSHLANQQMLIAADTAPRAVGRSVGDHDLHLSAVK